MTSHEALMIGLKAGISVLVWSGVAGWDSKHRTLRRGGRAGSPGGSDNVRKGIAYWSGRLRQGVHRR